MATAATSVPNPSDIARAEKFTREAFVHAGETTEEALALGTARRRALDAALLEIDAGAKVPSTEWRRRYSLMLGLERVLSEDEPKLADGTSLNPHQVDALSGTLTALLAEAQRQNGNGAVNGAPSAAPVLAVDDDDRDFEQPASVAIEDREDGEDGEDDEEPEIIEPLDFEVDIDIDDDDDDDEDDEAEEEETDEDGPEGALDEDQLDEQPDDPNAHKRFWFEHATGAGKTVAAMGFVDASRTGGILILTHRRNLVDQFHGELKDRGYAKRVTPALLKGQDSANGPVTVETYQWFVRNAGNISPCYSIVICDEAHTALGEKTSGAIREWSGPIFIGMTATGALIARHVTDLFPTQTSRFDLAQAARRGVIAPLRGVRIPPGPGVRTIAKVPLRRGEVDVEFDQEMLAELLDQAPFNYAVADLYKTRFNGVPGVVYAAGVRHAYNVAEAFREQGMKAMGVSGETPKRELAEILASYERGDIDVLVNAQLLAEGWNSPRATVCMHLAPTASKRIYQQRVGRVTRRHPGKEAGIVVDFVAPDTKNDDPVVTLHSLLDRDVYRGGAIVVGPVRRGRGRRVRVERRVLPVTSDEDRRIEVFERELWRIAVEHLPYGEQIQWAALAGARVAPSGWRRARAMLHFDRGGEFKRAFLLTAVERNKNPQLRLRALQEIAASGDPEAFDRAVVDVIPGWTREERREGTKICLLALAEKRIGRRDQANDWIWRLASYTREVHEEYAVQRWPETKRLLGLLVNSSGAAHARNARRLVHAARKQDRRLSAAILAAAIAHTPEGEEILRGARTRLARKPSALSRELLRNFPKSRGRRGNRRRRKKGGGAEASAGAAEAVAAVGAGQDGTQGDERQDGGGGRQSGRGSGRQRSRRSRNGRAAHRDSDPAREPQNEGEAATEAAPTPVPDGEAPAPARGSRRSTARRKPDKPVDEAVAVEAIADAAAALLAARAPKQQPPAGDGAAPSSEQALAAAAEGDAPKPKRRAGAGAGAGKPAQADAPDAAAVADDKPARRRATRKPARADAPDAAPAAAASPSEPVGDDKPKRRRPAAKTAASAATTATAAKAKASRARKAAPAKAEAEAEADAAAASPPPLDEAKPKRRRAPARGTSAKTSAAGGDEESGAGPLDDGVESAA
ncbi:MAG: DEAD/DEAH box helicase [Thermoleophilia bacterium]